jgi:hypothetical protein
MEGFCAAGRSWLPLLEVDVGVALASFCEKELLRDCLGSLLCFFKAKGGKVACGERLVEMGEGEETHGSKLGGAAVVFNRKREASAKGRRPGRRGAAGEGNGQRGNRLSEGDQRWLVLWFGRRSWERWVVCGGCSGVLLEKKNGAAVLEKGRRFLL